MEQRDKSGRADEICIRMYVSALHIHILCKAMCE